MILVFNISNFYKQNHIYILTFYVAHWDTWDDSFMFSMQGEDIS